MNKHIIFQEISTITHPQHFSVSADESLLLILFCTQTADYSVTIGLDGRGAEADILGFIIGNKTDTIKITSLQKHTHTDTRSDLHIKSVLRDQAFLQYHGFIRITEGAQRSNAYQRNDNLLLSPHAKTETSPGLEILANDVRCTHGATIGKMNEEELFYLKSRGVSQKMSEQLLLEGFFTTLANKISDEKMRLKVLTDIANNLVNV